MYAWLKRRRILLAIVGAFTLLLAAPTWLRSSLLWSVEGRWRDSLVIRGRHALPNPKLVYVAIDSGSVQLEGLWPEEIDASPALKKMKQSWPYPRGVYPFLIDRLLKAGAKVVIFDLLFFTSSEDDAEFKNALDQHADRVVIGSNFVAYKQERGKDQKSLQLPSTTLIAQSKTDNRVGFVNFWPDVDQVVRSASYRVTEEEVNGQEEFGHPVVLDSLAAKALKQAGYSNLIPPQRKPYLFRYVAQFSGNSDLGFAPYPLWEIIFDKTWNLPPYNGGSLFKDKIVLIGPDGNFLKDVVTTPFGPESLPGPVEHLNAMNAALNGDFLQETSDPMNVLLILAGGLLAIALAARVHSPLLRFCLIIAAIVAYYGVALLCYNMIGLFILVFAPPAAFASSGMTWLVWEQVLDRLEKLRVRRTLERYVSKNVVQEILDNPQSFLNSMSGQRRPCAILFTDIRGFTTMTESADSEQLVTQLNEYFSDMVKLIFQQKGSLDKFIGDAIMAVWGNVHTEGQRMDAELAVTCGILMQAGLKKLNADWELRGIQPLHMGVGVNFGEVIVGNLGSAEKMEVTVIGDAVNLASRLEGLTKEFHQEVIVGENIAKLLSDRFHLLPVAYVQAKGKTKPIEIFSIVGVPGEPLSDEDAGYLKAFREGTKLYRTQKFEEGKCLFQESLKLPSDGLALDYIKSCDDFIAHPPGPDWDGVRVMKTK